MDWHLLDVDNFTQRQKSAWIRSKKRQLQTAVFYAGWPVVQPDLFKLRCGESCSIDVTYIMCPCKDCRSARHCGCLDATRQVLFGSNCFPVVFRPRIGYPVIGSGPTIVNVYSLDQIWLFYPVVTISIVTWSRRSRQSFSAVITRITNFSKIWQSAAKLLIIQPILAGFLRGAMLSGLLCRFGWIELYQIWRRHKGDQSWQSNEYVAFPICCFVSKAAKNRWSSYWNSTGYLKIFHSIYLG